MARPPAPAPPPPSPWPDSRHAPRRGGPSQPAPRPPPVPPDPPPSPPFLGGSRRVLFADSLGLPLARLRQYRPWDPRGREGGRQGEGEAPGGAGGERGEQPPGSWMRPGKGRPQEAEDALPPPPDCSTEPDPSPTPSPDATQGAEEEAVARELELLYLSHLRRLRGEPSENGDPPPKNGGPPFPERAPNTSLANEMALRYEEEGGGTGGRSSPPVLLGRGGPVEGALVVPARPPQTWGGPRGGLGGALRGCGVVLALAVLVPVAWGGDGGGPTAALALGLYLALAWLT